MIHALFRSLLSALLSVGFSALTSRTTVLNQDDKDDSFKRWPLKKSNPGTEEGALTPQDNKRLVTTLSKAATAAAAAAAPRLLARVTVTFAMYQICSPDLFPYPRSANPFPPMINFIVATEIIIHLFHALCCSWGSVFLFVIPVRLPGLLGTRERTAEPRSNKIQGIWTSSRHPKHHFKGSLLRLHNAALGKGAVQFIV